MPQSSSSPLAPRGEEIKKCHCENGAYRSALDPQQQLQTTGKGQGEKEEEGIERSNITDADLDLRLQLARFVAALPARWRSRQRVSSLGLGLAELTDSISCDEIAAQNFPGDFDDDGDEGEQEGAEGGGGRPTLALLAFRSGSGDGNGALLSSLGAAEAVSPNFQILAACRDVRAAEELASLLLAGGGGGGPWQWRPLSHGGGPGGGSLLAQLFRQDRSPASSSALLVASDYDHTLIDDNSDTLVVEALGASETLESLWKSKSRSKRSEDFGWTEAVEEALRSGAAATARAGARDPREVVLSAAASAPCSLALREVLLSVCRRRRRGRSDSSDPRNHLAILSDANDVFIEHGLRANGLLGLNGEGKELDLVAVATNPAEFVDVPPERETGTPAHRRLALSRATARYGPHSCPLSRPCPANLCKGQLLAKLLVAGPGAPYSRGVLYCGDGANDVCPAVSCLGPLDGALVRERYGKDGNKAAFGAAVLPSSSACSLLSSSSSSSPPCLSPPKTKLLCRSVVAWSTQEELAEALEREARGRGGGCNL